MTWVPGSRFDSDNWATLFVGPTTPRLLPVEVSVKVIEPVGVPMFCCWMLAVNITVWP